MKSPKPQPSQLSELCQNKHYHCFNLSMPSVEELQNTYDCIDLAEQDFLFSLLEYQLLCQRVSNIKNITDLTNEEIISQAIALLEIVEEAKLQGKEVKFV